jgi:hypothetical protein
MMQGSSLKFIRRDDLILSYPFLCSSREGLKANYNGRIISLCTFRLPVTKIYINPLKTKTVCFIQGLCPYRTVNTLHLGYKNQSLNAVKAKVAVCSEIRTKHINAMWVPRRIF